MKTRRAMFGLRGLRRRLKQSRVVRLASDHGPLFSFGCLCFSLFAFFACSAAALAAALAGAIACFVLAAPKRFLLVLLCRVSVRASALIGGGFFDAPAAGAGEKVPAAWQGTVVRGASPHLLADESSYAVIVALNGPAAGRRLIAYARASLLQPGRIIVTRAALRAGRRQSNPGGFDEAAWIRSHGAVAVADLKTAAATTVEDTSPAGRWRALWQRCRAFFLRPVRRLFPPHVFPFVQALTGGGTRFLSGQAKALFTLSGLMHLTAVSGTHLMILLLPLRRQTVRAALGDRLATLLAVILMSWLYMICGGTSSIGRAVAFRLVRLVLDRGKRVLPPPDDAAAAGCLLLLVSPSQVFAAGFWLSLVSSTAISLLAGRFARLFLSRLPSAAAAPLSVSLAAQLTVLPLSVPVGQGFCLIAPLLNPLALIPVVVATSLSLFALIALPAVRLLSSLLSCFGWAVDLPSRFAAALTPLLELASETLLFLASIGASRRFFLPQSLFQTAALAAWLAFFVFLFGLVKRHRGRLERSRLRPAARRLAALLLAVFVFTSAVDGLLARPAAIEVWFLDVGQGDAAVIVVPGGPVLLIDGGRSGCGFRDVLPFLHWRGIRMIDLAIVSHGHEDHAAGILELLALGRVRAVGLAAVSLPYAGGVPREDQAKQAADRLSGAFDHAAADLTREIVETAQQKNVPVHAFEAGQRLTFGRLTADVIAPVGAGGDANDLSLQMRFAFGPLTLFFTGDATVQTESEVVAAAPAPVDVLKVAHHGARLTTGDAVLRLLRPKIAVISVGVNHYGHPAPEVLSRLGAIGADSFRTDENGAIKLSLRGRKVRIEPWRKRSNP